MGNEGRVAAWIIVIVQKVVIAIIIITGIGIVVVCAVICHAYANFVALGGRRWFGEESGRESGRGICEKGDWLVYFLRL